jgi:hypothetical protein
MKSLKITFALLLSLAASEANASWHGGRVTQISVGYDGNTMTFVIEGWVRSDCTCYSAWPNSMCLDRSRASYKEEVAMLLSARARGTQLFANIDEASCRVVAMYEID